METLKLGGKVQVNVIICANGPGLAPTKRWVGGYTLEGIVNDVAVVKRESGLFAGCLVNYALEDVRAV